MSSRHKDRPSRGAQPVKSSKKGKNVPNEGIMSSAQGLEALEKLRKRSDFICDLKFINELPEVPLEPKFMKLPEHADSLYRYNPIRESAAEANHVWELHAEHADLGVMIDLIDPDVYLAPNEADRPPLDPLDAEITSEKYAKPVDRNKKLSRRRNIEATGDWVRRTTFFHTDVFDNVYKHADTRRLNQALVDRRLRETEASLARKTKQERIEDAFTAVGPDATIRHPTDSSLKPVEVWNVIPDEVLWAFQNLTVVFDELPDKNERQTRRMRHSIVRTPPERPRSEAEGLVGCLHVPDARDVAPLDTDASIADEDPDEIYLRNMADYNMTIKTFRRKRRDAAMRELDPSKAGENVPLEELDEHLLLVWNNETHTVSYAPLHARIECAKIPRAQQTRDVVRLRRPWTQIEQDTHDSARVEIVEANPMEARAQIAQRKLNRLKQEQLEMSSRQQTSMAYSAATADMSSQQQTSMNDMSNVLQGSTSKNDLTNLQGANSNGYPTAPKNIIAPSEPMLSPLGEISFPSPSLETPLENAADTYTATDAYTATDTYTSSMFGQTPIPVTPSAPVPQPPPPVPNTSSSHSHVQSTVDETHLFDDSEGEDDDF